MAQRLKDYYGVDFARQLGEKLAATGDFDTDGFVRYLGDRLGEESMLARQDLYADALEAFLGEDAPANLRRFASVWGEELPGETGMFTTGYWLWPFARYVQRHGLSCPEAAYEFIENLTKRHTGEFAIRPLLIHRTKETMERMRVWCRDSNVHVRRLASEGLRISLPWAPKTTAALTQWDLYTDILGQLKDDRSRFVQKSVGNNLNDLFKHDPALAERLIAPWEAAPLSPPAQWVLRHGRRGLRKPVPRKPKPSV